MKARSYAVVSASVLGMQLIAFQTGGVGRPVATAHAQDTPPPVPTPLAGLVYDAPFFPGAIYDPKVSTPDAVLGLPVGSRPATPAQIEAVIQAIADSSPRCRLFEYGRTHEGRSLHYLVIANEANIGRLDALKADLARLADPRTASRADADRLAATLPAVAWMAYSIHGDEMSGCDAALAVAYHLSAGTGRDVTDLLEQLVVIIDPLMNPDGRARFLDMAAQNRTVQPSVDDQSLLHTGFWPYGRMNHYLFDMNRDWIVASQPETRGRIVAIGEWNPHYFMESHEMGSQDTFLFLPPREAINPNIPDNVLKWEDRFGVDQAAAFDARGWRYYNGEWNDNWYPGYSSSWAALRGAVENLYEQASISVDAVRRPEGALHTYRESVHKQLVSTMANLATLAQNRREVLADFVAEKRKCVGPSASIPAQTFAIVPSANAGRLERFLDLMAIEGFEMSTAQRPFSASGIDRLGRTVKDREFPAGTVLIPTRQPLARLLLAMLEFDPRMSPQVLTDERRDLLRFGQSRIYDITAWSLPMLFDVDAVALAEDPPAAAQGRAVEAGSAMVKDQDGSAAAAAAAPAPAAEAAVAFVVDGADDRSVAVAGRLMERGVWVRVADQPFQFEGRAFSRGSLVIARKDNAPVPVELVATLEAVCGELRVPFTPVHSGLGPGDLADLGGRHFVLLQLPRIAVVGRAPFSPYGFGEAWYLIDHVLGLRASYVDAEEFGDLDLRRYNVLVLPAGGADELKGKMESLRAWAAAGGTIVAVGSSAAAFAKEKDGIGTTRLLPDVLGKLDDYRQAVVREWEGRRFTPDPDRIWSHVPPPEVVYPWLIDADEKPSDEELKRRDAWSDLFMPAGAMLAGRVDDRNWLTGGCGEYVPVMYSGDVVLMSPPDVQAPVRLGVFNQLPGRAGEAPPPAEAAEAKSDGKKGDKGEEKKRPAPGWSLAPPGQELRLRMAGLLWPEAASRLANAAYVTRESIGAGQLILFASDPTFRAGALGTTRIFANAVVLGPGMGASQPIEP